MSENRSENPLLPPINEENETFWQAARRGELWLQRCRDTERFLFPPRLLSPWGRHRAPEWVAVSGRGVIWSYVVPHPPLLPYFSERAPYNVILVALEEDPRIRLVGNLVARQAGELNEVDPETIEIGTPVRVVFDPPHPSGPSEGEPPLPRWLRI
jgi:uncharacterized OB-fold protein